MKKPNSLQSSIYLYMDENGNIVFTENVYICAGKFVWFINYRKIINNKIYF